MTEEINKAIRQLKSAKAAGEDMWVNEQIHTKLATCTAELIQLYTEQRPLPVSLQQGSSYATLQKR